MTPAHDVAIAGAGPAGVATAAALLCRRPSLRSRILLLDRSRFPREKPCGGGLTGRALDTMRALGLRLDVPHVSCTSAQLALGTRRRSVELPRPVVVVRRADFDASLVEQVRAAGADVREGVSLRGFSVGADGVRLDTSAGTFRARVLVGADGAASRVRRHVVGREETPLRLVRAEIPAREARDRRNSMLYDFSPMADGLRGYLWVFPQPGDRLNVGLMHSPSAPIPPGGLVGLLRRRLADLGIQILEGARGWPAWPYQPRAPLSVPRVLLVGDAAGIDAVTGEGIAVGMAQAMVAADQIVDALHRGDLSFRGYRRAVRKATVGRELALDRVFARLLYGRRWARWAEVVLSDPSIVHHYAARIAGTAVLADRKAFLLWALGRNWIHPARA